jgi:hypothetical protein
LRRGERGKVLNSREEKEGKTHARKEEREGRTKTTFELELLFKEGEKRTKPTINITTFIIMWFKCHVPYMHHTKGRHEHGQWSKYKASTSQTTLTLQGEATT